MPYINKSTILVEGKEVRVDNPLPTITVLHKLLHDGHFFSGGRFENSLANGGTINLLIQTGTDRSCNMSIFYATGGNATASVYEGTTFSAAGTEISLFNHNRQKTNTPDCTVTKSPTISDKGTRLDGIIFIPGGSKLAGSGSVEKGSLAEIILKKNEDYLIEMTNISGGVQPVEIQITINEQDL